MAKKDRERLQGQVYVVQCGLRNNWVKWSVHLEIKDARISMQKARWDHGLEAEFRIVVYKAEVSQ